MDHALARFLTTTALAAFAGVLSVAACTHTTDRVVEPVGGGDASAPTPATPAVGDSGTSPLGPIANPAELEPREDFRLVRSPEFGVAPQVDLVVFDATRQGGVGGINAGGGAGFAGSDLRPVSSGGGSYY